jgi:diacylglycerol kinase (ATP)
MKACFVFNPTSGRNRRRPGLVDAIEAFTARHGIDAFVRSTRARSHATQLAREAVDAGCTHVIAVGGDGTLNEVAQALVGTDAVLGLLPCGSGNGLALHLGIPTRFSGALDLLLPGNGAPRSIDTGIANGHPFFNVMGLGFDAEISRSFNGIVRRGLPAYIRTGLEVFARHRAEVFEIEYAGGRTRLDAFLVTVANSSQYGNNARIAPDASVDDGELDLVAVRPMNVFAAVPTVTRLFAGTLRANGRIVAKRGRHFAIRRERPGVIHVDGETHETGDVVSIEVRQGSLRVLVPAG